MNYSVNEKDDKWVVIKDKEIIATFDKQADAWRYVDRKDTHELWKTTKRWNWGR